MNLADRADFAAYEAGLRPSAERDESEHRGGQAHRYSEIVWMK
jgi:hypothetical protein